MSSIVQNMTRARGGWDSAFASPNGVLDAVSQVYVGPHPAIVTYQLTILFQARHLTYSAKGVYFIPLDSSAPRIIFGVLHDWQPRLVLEWVSQFLFQLNTNWSAASQIVPSQHTFFRRSSAWRGSQGSSCTSAIETNGNGFASLPYQGQLRQSLLSSIGPLLDNCLNRRTPTRTWKRSWTGSASLLTTGRVV